MEYGAEGTVVTILLFYFLIIALLGIGSLVSYILRGVGMYTLGKRRGMNYPWLAFIPYARTYFQGELCGTLHFGRRDLKNPGLWLLVIPVVGNLVMGVFMIFIWGGAALQVSNLVFQTYDYSAVYRQYQGGTSGAGMLLVVIGLVMLVLLSVAVSAVTGALQILVNRQIYGRYTPDNYALLHGVLGFFIPLYTSIYFFLIRSREKGIGPQGPQNFTGGPGPYPGKEE